MKKNLLVVVLVLTIFVSGVFVEKLLLSSNNIDDGFNDLSQIKYENTLSMMLEQTAGAGDYELETRSSWPTKEDGYVFNSTLSKCENGSKLRWDNENNAVVMVGTTSDKCYVYFDLIPPVLLANWVKEQYTGTQGENNLYYHNGTILDDSGNVIDANDGSYRYGGASETTNNYICFGSDATTCPEDNLYRIIGVFDNQVKLVKATYAGSNLLGTNGTYVSNNTYKFSNYDSCPSETTAYVNNGSVLKLANKNIIAALETFSGCYLWQFSELNTVNLNVNYSSSFSNLYLTKISDTIWTEENNEKQKFGLINKTDYQYMFSKEYWNLSYEGEYQNNNWFYQIVSYESPLWILGYVTISKADYEGRSTNIVNIYSRGFFSGTLTPHGSTTLGGEFYKYGVPTDCSFYIKPSFYLNSDVTVSGSHQGTSSDPIRIN